ncbi:hypothetical protein EYB53_008530 [Candidatus Chloroploca sp. M-50]|uniref:Uncharacterized protein n=1 Tax=Candidatus Chloroploca mongolica TaxID=2528176 RepID=A0ABS4D8H8_9CHLR|nr:hypothetical protein [Candidatus Chloroploca mongolica]MBP1465749.1 hypothetical protein [Candidatus Chloroploca mongolica]
MSSARPTFTILRRLQRRENIFAAHRTHVYQRLVIAGWSHRSVTLLYLGWAVLGVIIALLWIRGVPGSAIAAIIVPLLSAALLWSTVVVTERTVGQRNAV